MASITYVPPKGYPDKMRLTLMDGRAVEVIEGRHTYPDDVVARLHQTTNTNSAVKNMRTANVLILEFDQSRSQGFAMQSVGGQQMGHIPQNPPLQMNGQYHTDIPYSQGNMAPVQPNVVGGMAGYQGIQPSLPGWDSAATGQQVHQGVNQYDMGDGQTQTPMNAGGQPPIQINTPADIYSLQNAKFPDLNPLPNGQVSAVRANGQSEVAQPVMQQGQPVMQQAQPVMQQAQPVMQQVQPVMQQQAQPVVVTETVELETVELETVELETAVVITDAEIEAEAPVVVRRVRKTGKATKKTT
jgi:hypothetical protein